jgi:hypothetical protein
MNWQAHVEYLVSIRKDGESVSKYLEMLSGPFTDSDDQYDRNTHCSDSMLESTVEKLVKKHSKFSQEHNKKFVDQLVGILKYQRDKNMCYYIDERREYYGVHLGGDQCGGLEIAMMFQDVMNDYYESIGCTWCNG